MEDQQIAAQDALGDLRWQTPLQKVGDREVTGQRSGCPVFVLNNEMGNGGPEDIDRSSLKGCLTAAKAIGNAPFHHKI